MLPQLFEDGIERGNKQGDKVRPSLLASPARFCSVFLKRKREGREVGKRVHELGLGPPARPLCWLHGLMRKPIRREEEGKRGEGEEGQEEGGREGAIVFILMRAKEGAAALGNYSLTTTHSPKTKEGAKEHIVETRAFVPKNRVLLVSSGHSNARGADVYSS